MPLPAAQRTLGMGWKPNGQPTSFLALSVIYLQPQATSSDDHTGHCRPAIQGQWRLWPFPVLPGKNAGRSR